MPYSPVPGGVFRPHEDQEVTGEWHFTGRVEAGDLTVGTDGAVAIQGTSATSLVAGGDVPKSPQTVAVAVFHDAYTASQLENTLRSYRSVYTPITFQQWADWFTKGTPLPERPLLVTFDDGYALYYTDYKAVLDELSCPATFFITTKFIDAGTLAAFGVKTAMTWAQIRELQRQSLGHSFQCHTYTHLDCSTSSVAQITADLKASIARFGQELGAPPDALAWPGGKYTTTAQGIAEDLGYKFAFRVGTGALTADSPFVYLPIHATNPRYALNRGGILMAGGRQLYENQVPDPAWFPASDIWITASGASLTTDSAGDVIVRHPGSSAARTSATFKIPVTLGEFYHLELKKKAVYVGGSLTIQLLLSDYSEAALTPITVGTYTSTDADYVKINYDFRITNASAGWMQLAFVTDTSATGSRLDVKAMKLYQIPGLDSISGTRQLPKDVYS